ncbi:MAG TPA: N-acetylmuramic acid 6-phosphate etherase, partial [Agriterribacter sp.]|nr:N-acetylmuramic acid 6-phosphate etherase [Agriterribacter sp.]
MLITEMPSRFDGLEKMSVRGILEGINSEDQTVPLAVAKAIPQIEALVTAIVKRMKKGGRLFYIGAGTS